MRQRISAGLVAAGVIAVGIVVATSSPARDQDSIATTSTTAPNQVTPTERDVLETVNAAPPEGSGCSGEAVSSGTDLSQLAANAGQGAVFCLAPGTYLVSSPIRPKDNQKFIGTGEVVLTGSDSTQAAFEGYAASGVEVRGLIIERFNSAANNHHLAALHAGSGWRIVNNVIRNNTGVGVFHERDTLLRGNNIHHNRHSGIGGFKAHRSIIENNEIWENGAAKVGGESAGAKWVAGIDLTVRGNYAHHNYNNGLWLDADNVNARMENNRAESNYDKGLHFEASCSGTIRNNVSTGNNIGLLLVASRNVTVTGNTFQGNTEALRVAHLDRGPGDNCHWSLDNVTISDNTVKGGSVRVVEHNPPDPGAIFQPGDTRVTFDRNNYSSTTFNFGGTTNWNGWQAAGNDPSGTWTR